ncbi:MAG TPA: hypothetical protein VMP03_03645, partial [Methylomirabilota bacterium]|nr:hypothetical protein [Methylomirabilota bacterium]
MAREWDEGRGSREDQRDLRRSAERERGSGGSPDDFDYDRRRDDHGDDRPRHGDREGNPMRGTHADDRGGDFGYERQAGDHRGRGGFAPRAAMDPGYHEDFGDQEFGSHNRGRKTFGGDLGRTDYDRGYGENYGRGSDRRARHEFEQRGGYSGGSGVGPGYLGRGQTG